jgi:hypothetical protein
MPVILFSSFSEGLMVVIQFITNAADKQTKHHGNKSLSATMTLEERARLLVF